MTNNFITSISLRTEHIIDSVYIRRHPGFAVVEAKEVTFYVSGAKGAMGAKILAASLYEAADDVVAQSDCTS